MKKATIYTACECQARLGAELDEQRHALRGWAKDPRKKQQLKREHLLRAWVRLKEQGWIQTPHGVH